MANAIVALANITLTSAQPSVIFSNIPSTGYSYLRLVVSKKLTAQANSYIRFNGDTAGNYYSVGMGFNWQPVTGSFTANADTAIADHWGYGSTPDGSTSYIDIFNYAATGVPKTSLVRFNGMTTDGQWGMDLMAARWSGSSAITSITISLSTGQFDIGSTFSLYGVIG